MARLLVALLGILILGALSACEATASIIIPTALPTETATFTPSPTRTPARNVTPTRPPTRIAQQATAGPSPTDLFGATRTPLPEDFATPTRSLNPNAPRIEFFTADNLTIEPGGAVTLFWSARGVDQARIDRLDRDGQVAQQFIVPPDGSQTITTRSSDRGQLTFVLAAGEGAQRVQQTLVIPLQCPVAWFFAPAPDDCADEAAQEVTITDQAFERGRMLYVQATDTIYVLFNDGNQPAWITFDNRYDPEVHAASDPNFPPQPNRVQPVDELGYVWRTTGTVRNRLGLGIQEAVTFSGAWQTTTLRSDVVSLYLSGADGAVLHLVPGREQWQIIGAS